MSSILTVYLSGKQRESASQPHGDVISFETAGSMPLAQTTNEIFNQCVANCHSPYVAFVDGPSVGPFDAWKNVVDVLSTSTADVCLFPSSRNSHFARAWSDFPAKISCLLDAPEKNATVIFLRETMEHVGRFADTASPLWDWLIRAVNSEHTVSVSETGMNADTALSAMNDTFLLRSLVPHHPEPQMNWLRNHLSGAEPSRLLPAVGSQPDAVALQAGLFQVHDFLDDSHSLSQSIEGEGRNHAGDYWHAIMHRREPDYGNSKYWFRRVGRHPVFDNLSAPAARILAESESADAAGWSKRLGIPCHWNPAAFVDLCEACARSKDVPLQSAARQIQREELILLLRATYADALSGGI